MKLLVPMGFLQTQQQKHFSCHCRVLYSIFLVPATKRRALFCISENSSTYFTFTFTCFCYNFIIVRGVVSKCLLQMIPEWIFMLFHAIILIAASKSYVYYLNTRLQTYVCPQINSLVGAYVQNERHDQWNIW